MEKILTENWKDFGNREKDMACDLFIAIKEQGLPADFDNDGLRVAFNRNSGYVFLTNNDCQVAMLYQNDYLQSWHTCPICGHEGFKEDMQHNEDNIECQEYLKELGI